MSDQALESMVEGYWYIAAIAAMGLVGMMLVMVLLLAWRRHVTRRAEFERRRESREPTPESADLWQAGGQRLTSLVVPPPPAVTEDEDDASEDAPGQDDDEDEDDDDDDKEWWQRSSE